MLKWRKDVGKQPETMTLEEFEERLNKQSKAQKLFAVIVYRVKCFFDIEYHFSRIKWFIQRGKRGYSDCDTWNLYNYLLNILVPALENLQEIKHGCPANENEDIEEAFKRWTDELQIMIDGFKAGLDMEEMCIETTYEDFKVRHAELEMKFNKGMEMFVKRFWHLWD